MPSIHPTAMVDGSAQLADDVEIGPYCIVEAETCIGEGTRLMSNVIIRRYTTLGKGNQVHPFSVLGGDPQDLKFDPATRSTVVIGDGNVFRESCTVNRGTGEGAVTRIGNNNYFMAYAHAGHNVTVGSNAILVNGSALGGHSTVGDRAILSSHVAVHQFCSVGEMCMGQGNCVTTGHVPPYVIFAGTGQVQGLNIVGLRRAEHISREDIKQIREAFNIFFRRGLPTMRALEEMDACNDWGEPADRFREFIRKAAGAEGPYKRVIATLRDPRR
ncbi:MAG: acyl-ACP--UDP-N-acetylglucosamine O-acyltransferase [Phycisphaerae bacterium]